MRRRSALLAGLCTVALAACGDDDEPQPVAVPDGTEKTLTQDPALETDGDGRFDPPVPNPTADGCGRVDGRVVELLTRDLTCERALAAASAYDFQGAKVQEVEDFTCEGGEAATRPVVLV